AQSTAPWKLVVFHHAPYGSGYHGDDPVMQWPFQAWGASAVLTGHDHDYERLIEGGLPYFIDGLGGESIDDWVRPQRPGRQIRYNGNYGAMRVDASDTQIQFQFFARTGQLIDTYTMTNGPTPPTVSIAASDAYAAAFGTDPGAFTLTRTGSTTNPLTVNL